MEWRSWIPTGVRRVVGHLALDAHARWMPIIFAGVHGGLLLLEGRPQTRQTLGLSRSLVKCSGLRQYSSAVDQILSQRKCECDPNWIYPNKTCSSPWWNVASHHGPGGVKPFP